MAKFYPTIENISRLKVKPTEGEQYLLNYLEENLDDSYEVFFNPFLDGDRPDFIIIREGVAIFIIEVKDYNLDNYQVDSFNKWSVKYANRQSRISSPQSQAFTYKKNLYQLHLPVLGIGQLGKVRISVEARFKGSADEPTSKDAVWTADDIFKVGVINDGTDRSGYAEYVCNVLYDYGFKGKKVWVQVIDIVKLTRSSKWEKLGEAHCL